jgi:hypothetical protein
MKGGKKTCKRTGEIRNNCHVMNCVDYENRRYDSFEELDCSDIKKQKSSNRTKSRSIGRTKSRSNGRTKSRSNGRTKSRSKSDTEWEEFWDVAAATNYYYNHKTGEANWVKPDGKYKKLQKK